MRILITILFLPIAAGLFAQTTAAPTVVSSGGGFATSGGNSFSFTIGEPVVVTAGNTTNYLTQGFQQPSSDSILTGDSTLIVIYNGITPNGDNHNDTWIIDGIDTLQNTVHIFNRWGDLVWQGENYDNTTIVWDGTGINSIKLPAGTYFYVIAIRGETHKGWVELTR